MDNVEASIYFFEAPYQHVLNFTLCLYHPFRGGFILVGITSEQR